MDPASKIFDFLYLGSEWNASNLEVGTVDSGDIKIEVN
jgi:hypothetical protein